MKHKNEILKLRQDGKSYKEIQDILHCSKGTIAYHCGLGQKEKTKLRTEKIGWKKNFSKKLSFFNQDKTNSKIIKAKTNKLKTIIGYKLKNFQHE